VFQKVGGTRLSASEGHHVDAFDDREETQVGLSRRTDAAPAIQGEKAMRSLFLASVLSIAPHTYAQPLAYTPQELLATHPREFVEWLNTHQPASVAPEEKARIFARLPTQGEITELDARGRLKLVAVNRLLHATDRDAWYEVKVTDVEYARIVVFARAVILISKSALWLLDEQDLQALVAHEIGHEYFTTDYEDAFKAGDHRRLKDLELLCDAFAIVTLHRLGMNPARLVAGVEKITRHNGEFLATRVDDTNYPTVAERRSFAREITTWLQAP